MWIQRKRRNDQHKIMWGILNSKVGEILFAEENSSILEKTPNIYKIYETTQEQLKTFEEKSNENQDKKLNKKYMQSQEENLKHVSQLIRQPILWTK